MTPPLLPPPPGFAGTLLAGMLLAGMLAHPICQAAQTRSFAITGTIETDCGFDPSTVTFDLGDVEVTRLSTLGSSTDWVEGALVSTGCAGIEGVTMVLSGTADPDDARLFAATGGASGIGIELGTADGQPIIPNGPGVTLTPQSAGSAYVYRARYVRTTAPLQVGPAAATITVSIVHE